MTEKMKQVCIALAEHTIGMDSQEVWRTHGTRVYVPYRNYFSAARPDNAWEAMVEEGYAKRYDGKESVQYSMTPDGIQWLARELKVNICLTP